MKVVIPETVLSTDLPKEGVLLNLETGEYYGLDEVGMDMWRALSAHGTIEAARAALLELYEVAEDTLIRDLDGFVARLLDRRLIQLTDE